MSYFIIVNNIQQGPFTLDELRLHGLSSDTLVWAEGMPQWTPAWQVAELRPLLEGFTSSPQGTGTPPPPPPPPLHTGSVPEYPNAAAHAPQTATAPICKKRRWPYWVTGAFLALVVIAGITNPSKAEHQDVLQENIANGLSQVIADEAAPSSASPREMLGRFIAGPIIDQALHHLVSYNNYIVFSTTSILTPKGEVTLSYGFLGKVLTADKDKVAQAIALSAGTDDILKTVRALTGHEEQTAVPDETEPSSPSPQTTPPDTTALSSKIEHVIIDHVADEVKKEIGRNTDRATSGTIENIIDNVIEIIKGL